MLSIVLGFITGLAGPIAAVVNKITDLRQARLQAATNIEKANIDKDIEQAHDRKAVLVAEAGSRINAYMRFLIALGPAAYLTKIFLWDKTIGAIVGCSGNEGNTLRCHIFNTDPLDPNLWWIALSVVGFYFLATVSWKK